MKFRSRSRRLNEARIEANMPRGLEKIITSRGGNIRYFSVTREISKTGKEYRNVDISIDFGNGSARVKSDYNDEKDPDNLNCKLDIMGWGRVGTFNDVSKIAQITEEVRKMLDIVYNAASVLRELQAFDFDDLATER